MNVLGLNAYHGDSSACLVRDGQLVAAAEEERFRRIKHWAGFPTESIRYCLMEAGLDLSAIDHVAINQNPRSNLWRKIAYGLLKRPNLSLVADRLRNRSKREDFRRILANSFGPGFSGQVHAVDHHLSHLASGFLVSPFETSCVASVDGFGDFASAAWGIGTGSRISVDGQVHFPHSLGLFYQALTQYLGFPKYGDEYKVMGLAPYGRPSLMDEMRRIVHLEVDGTFSLDLDCFLHHSTRVPYAWDNGEPTVGPLFSRKLENILGPARLQGTEITQRHKDIAHSIQAMYEDAFFSLLNALHRKHRSDSLALAGGCAMNSVANGKVTLRTPFKKVYVQAAAGDAGGAIGAALHVSQLVASASLPRFHMDHAYWGPSFPDACIEGLLASHKERLDAANCSIQRHDARTLCHRAAKSIANGKVLGWFQGRMEWGPRALGNRSILCDPRRTDMKDILNAKIKRRESFRPFAPSILREAVAEWFEIDDDVPFMMQVFQFRPEKRDMVPAVVHVDGSGRLQTVERESNPLYYDLIKEFRDITSVPMILNTSFNENEPVVCRPEQALDCFLRTHMDALAMGSYFVERKD